jgi:hypothetical protein
VLDLDAVVCEGVRGRETGFVTGWDAGSGGRRGGEGREENVGCEGGCWCD